MKQYMRVHAVKLYTLKYT